MLIMGKLSQYTLMYNLRPSIIKLTINILNLGVNNPYKYKMGVFFLKISMMEYINYAYTYSQIWNGRNVHMHL